MDYFIATEFLVQVASMIAAFINTLRRWRNERRAIEELAQLSDDRLNDIGISRGNLERAVRYGLSG